MSEEPLKCGPWSLNGSKTPRFLAQASFVREIWAPSSTRFGCFSFGSELLGRYDRVMAKDEVVPYVNTWFWPSFTLVGTSSLMFGPELRLFLC